MNTFKGAVFQKYKWSVTPYVSVESEAGCFQRMLTFWSKVKLTQVGKVESWVAGEKNPALLTRRDNRLTSLCCFQNQELVHKSKGMGDGK